MGKKNNSERSGLAFVGFLMMGLGVGILYNQVAVGVLIGLGLGFISMAILGTNDK
ncbi:MAG: hypothetical protein KKC05_01480 [Nanoarchaeota archaeon]|nr:hypothetical protein [Nanoarchaeota archaeon]